MLAYAEKKLILIKTILQFPYCKVQIREEEKGFDWSKCLQPFLFLDNGHSDFRSRSSLTVVFKFAVERDRPQPKNFLFFHPIPMAPQCWLVVDQ